MFQIKTKALGKYDVAVCGGGVAGVAAAVTAARGGASVILVERAGALGGTMTEGFIPLMLDRDNKGGIVKELFAFLDERGMSCARHGDRVNAEGNKIPGPMVDTEGVKYFFDRICEQAGVKVLYHSQISALDMDEDRITSALIATECGNYSLQAEIYIDVTGIVGIRWKSVRLPPVWRCAPEDLILPITVCAVPRRRLPTPINCWNTVLLHPLSK